MRRLMLGLALAAATALAPCLAIGDDQAIAEHISKRLKAEQQRGALQGYHLDMQVERGTVWFTGQVTSDAQKDLVLRTAQMAHHLGVVQVVDDIEVRQAARAQAPMAAAPSVNSVVPTAQAAPMMPPAAGQAQQASWRQETQDNFNGSQAISPGVYGTAPVPMHMGQPVPMGAMPINGGMHMGGVNGMPMGVACPPGQGGMVMGGAVAGPMVGVATDNPMMPGYAWPSYAAYPNYAAVTYPRQYSPTAWPYIGPFYPYPQVPLGWRKVTLEWDSGWWFLDFHNR